jgi:ferritin
VANTQNIDGKLHEILNLAAFLFINIAEKLSKQNEIYGFIKKLSLRTVAIIDDISSPQTSKKYDLMKSPFKKISTSFNFCV